MDALRNDGEDDVFLDEDDILEEINVDEEDLPEADDEDEVDDSVHTFTGLDDSVHTFTGHDGEVYTVACSPSDPALVATGAGDDKGFLWRLCEGDRPFELKDHSDSVSCVSFSSDGQLLASGSFDGFIRVWDISSGNVECKRIETGSGIEWVRWHPRGRFVLAGSKDNTVWMWWHAGDTVYSYSGHSDTVTCGDFTPDGKTICTGSDDASLRIWNPRVPKSIHVVEGHDYHTQGITCLAITADSSCVLTGSIDGSVHMVKITTGEVVTSLMSHTDSIECIGLSSGSPQRAATGSMDQKLIIWDLQYSVARCICEHGEGVTCVCWLGGTIYVATGCVDGGVRIWDSLSGACVKTMRGHRDVVQSIAISADYNFLVSVSLDETARVFQIHEFFPSTK